MERKISVYSKNGDKAGTVSIVSINVEEYAQTAYALSVRSLLQGWRQGTVGSKSRGEVSLTNHKPWRQKGTGRARAGTSRSPLWRKGGVTFGPQPRISGIKISREQRRRALRSVFSSVLATGSFYCLDAGIEGGKPSAKEAQLLLAKLGVFGKKVVVFLSLEDTKTYLSFRNIPNVRVVFFDQPNVFDISNAECWVVLKKDMNFLNEMVEKWK